jgi:hypothetical protein
MVVECADCPFCCIPLMDVWGVLVLQLFYLGKHGGDFLAE